MSNASNLWLYIVSLNQCITELSVINMLIVQLLMIDLGKSLASQICRVPVENSVDLVWLHCVIRVT